MSRILERSVAAIQIARNEAQYIGGRIANKCPVAADPTREEIVNDHRWNGGKQPHGGRE